MKLHQEQSEEFDVDLSHENIINSQLIMIFAICSPIIPAVAQMYLALKILCGFGINEITEAFLTSKETLNKHLFKAKEKLQRENIKIELSEKYDIETRI